MADTKKTHIAILPTPGMGHLIPLVEFSKTLFRQHGILSTFFVPTDGPLSKAQKSFLSDLPASIEYVLLPPVCFDDLGPDTWIETVISLTITRSLPSLHDAVKASHDSKKFSAFVVDLFGTDGFDVAAELGIPPYMFFPSTAMLLSLILHLPKLDESVSCEYWEMSEKLQIPGCVPIHGSELVAPLQDRKNEAYRWILHHSKRYSMAEGLMVNTFNELEPVTIKTLQENGSGSKPSIHPIGPLVQMGSNSKSEDPDSSKCLKWLDQQPNNSVLFISLGSGGKLSHDQLIEMALGLELSEQKFLWVIRCPNDTAANAAYFKIQDTSDPLAYLPQGFVERTKNQGLVMPLWAPQAQILAHSSICGFLSHCGWNSTLESVVSGVPLIAWPLYAEQRMNAVLLNEDVKVALRPEVGENELVGRFDIKNVVKNLVEGEEGKGIRNRMRDLKDAAAKVLSQDGSSTKSLAQVVNKWKSHASS
ncbi:hydroquinone glucosyltransferase-like [Primulina huaijiensis]|uniref:hydroquinone glucosyltransferase-like n=1 Tax=Primulina huaijiensis TaxID=1492673 RepID=UPI003CC755A9